MKVFILIILTVFLGACTQKDFDKDQYEEDIVEINELREKERQAAMAGNVDSLMAIRTDGFISIPPNQPSIEGIEAVGDFLTEIHKQTDTELTFISDEITISGDLAYDRGRLEGRATPKNDGEAVNFEGTYLFILKRQTDKSWKYSLAMWNSY